MHADSVSEGNLSEVDGEVPRDRQEGQTSLGRASGIIAACTLASRILGFVRDAVCVAVFGMGTAMSAFYLAWIVPNLFRRFFGEGALAAAFIPRAATAVERGGRSALRDLLAQVHGALVVILSGAAAIGILGCWLLPPERLEGFLEPDQAKLFLEVTATLFPYVVLVCSLALWMGALNTVQHFFAPALAPALLNLVWILGALAVQAFAPESWNADRRVLALAWIILCGAVLQVLVHLHFLKRERLLVWPRPRLRDPQTRAIGRSMLPVVLGLAVVQFNLILDQVMAIGFVSANANNYTYLGNRLMQFPLGVIGIAVATAVFPRLARAGERGDLAMLEESIRKAFQFVTFLAVPAACGLVFLATPITRVLFEHGKVTGADVIETARAVSFYAIGVPAFCAIHLLTRAFYALGDTRTPMRIVTRLVLCNIALNFALVFPMGVSGLALATSLTALLNAVLLGVSLARSRSVHVLPRGSESPWKLILTGVLACALAALLEREIAGGESSVWSLLMGVGAGAALYLVLARFLAPVPLASFLALFRRGRSSS